MEPLGYTNWQNFERVISDARRSTFIVGTGQDQFTDGSKLVSIGNTLTPPAKFTLTLSST